MNVVNAVIPYSFNISFNSIVSFVPGSPVWSLHHPPRFAHPNDTQYDDSDNNTLTAVEFFVLFCL